MRRGILVFICGALVLLVVGAGPVGGASAAECPNEALRVGPSALLPECRAYEQVTPVEKKGGTGIFVAGLAQAAPSGEAVSFISPSAYADASGSPLGNRYLSGRAGGNWATKSVDGPQAIEILLLVRATFALSPELGLSITASKEALAPGAEPGGSNLYLRDTATGASTLLASAPGNEFFREMTSTSGKPFAGASADWSHLLLFSTQALAAGAKEGQANTYEFSGGELRLALPPGDEPAANVSNAETPNLMSADGSRFFFKKENVLYLREGGTKTIPISASKVIPKGQEGHLAEAVFAGATPSGSSVFFTSSGNLTGESEGQSLYRYERAAGGDRLTDLTPDSINRAGKPGAGTVLAVAENGEYVYFSSLSTLTADAPEAEESSSNIYVWHGAPGEAGTIRYIAQTEPENSGETRGPEQYRASPDGLYFAMGSRSPLTTKTAAPASPACPGSPTEGVPPERCINVFAYSYPEESLACLTCTSAPSPGDSTLGGQDALEEYFTYVPQSVLDDGTVYFNTVVPLVPRDTNGVGDVYEWRVGRSELLSTGLGDTASTFGDAAADGRNVFIRSTQQLVGQDTDSVLDLYDVRVDGGIAAQGGATPTTECNSEASCRSGFTSPPAASPPSSSDLHGAGDLAGRCTKTSRQAAAARHRVAALRRRAKKAGGRHARILRRRAAHEGAKAAHLAKRARACTKGAAR